MKVCRNNILECEDAQLERRQFTNAAGVVVHCLQCMTCGRHTTTKVKRDGSNPPELDRALAEQTHELERQQWADDAAAARRKADEEREAKRSQYSAYLASPAWAAIRERVKQRDKICQGCLAAPIEEVHHLTYEHVQNEFAFELIGLCRKCHARLHGMAA